MHEIGHCLGLGHVPPNPVWLGQDANSPDWPAGFLPEPLAGLSSDPQMSTAASYGVPGLTLDDRIGVSLLYPAPGFLEERGSIGGRLRDPGGRNRRRSCTCSPWDYASGAAVFGPGAFADERGQFPPRGPAGRSGPPLGASDATAHGRPRVPAGPLVGPAGRAPLVLRPPQSGRRRAGHHAAGGEEPAAVRNLRLAGVIGCVVAGAACGDGSPAAPSPSDLLRPSREPMQIRFDGVFYVPHQVIELRPGGPGRTSRGRRAGRTLHRAAASLDLVRGGDGRPSGPRLPLARDP